MTTLLRSSCSAMICGNPIWESSTATLHQPKANSAKRPAVWSTATEQLLVFRHVCTRHSAVRITGVGRSTRRTAQCTLALGWTMAAKSILNWRNRTFQFRQLDRRTVNGECDSQPIGWLKTQSSTERIQRWRFPFNSTVIQLGMQRWCWDQHWVGFYRSI